MSRELLSCGQHPPRRRPSKPGCVPDGRDRTLLRLVHCGLPLVATDLRRAGSNHCLDRLVIRATGGDPARPTPSTLGPRQAMPSAALLAHRTVRVPRSSHTGHETRSAYHVPGEALLVARHARRRRRRGRRVRRIPAVDGSTLRPASPYPHGSRVGAGAVGVERAGRGQRGVGVKLPVMAWAGAWVHALPHRCASFA